MIEKDTYRQRANNLYSWFTCSPMYSMFSNRAEYVANVRFVQGMMDPRKYNELKDPQKSHVVDATAINMSPHVLNVVSKPFRLLKGKLAEARYEPQVNPSVVVEQDVALQKATVRAIMSMALPPDQLKRAMMRYGIKDMPTTNEDIDIQAQVGAKEQICMKHESDLINIANSNKLNDQLDQNDFDLLCAGFSCFEVRKKNGTIFQDGFDAKDLMCGYFEKEDAADLTEAGRVRFLTLSQIKGEAIKIDGTSEFTTEEWNGIKKQEILPYGTPDTNYPYYTPNYKTDGVIKVLNYYWAVDESTFYQKSVTKFGNTRIYEREKEGKKNAISLYKPMVYTCSWIIGTDFVYNCRALPECTYMVDSVFKYDFPIKIVAPLIKFGRPMPLVSEIVELAETVELAWKKMKEDMAAALPLGYQIDREALSSVAFKFKGNRQEADKMIDLAITRNIHVYNGSKLNGASNGKRVVEVVQGGVSDTFNVWWEIIRNSMDRIEYITTPDQSLNNPDTGKGTAEINQDNSSKANQHLFSAKRRMYEMITRSTLLLKLQSEPIQPPFQITCNQKPTKEEWMEFKGLVQLALKTPIEQGGISASDATYIYSIDNYKQANEYLRNVGKRNKKEAMMLAQQVQQFTAQEQEKNFKMKLDGDLAIIDRKGEWTIKNTELLIRGNIATTEHKGELAGERADQTALHKQTLEEQKAMNDMQLNEHGTDEDIYKELTIEHNKPKEPTKNK